MEEDDATMKKMLELQVSEVEMLCSMFPSPGEFVMDSEVAIPQIKSFIDGELDYTLLDTRIGFTVKITAKGRMNLTVELICHLPHDYPVAAPEVLIRAPQLNREAYQHLSEDLNRFLLSLERGEICVGSLVQWLQENLPKYLESISTSVSARTVSSKADTEFTRLWVYSHHIYSKTKRRDILEWGHELQVSGFCMPGKPGVICIEGYSSQVEEFWNRLRRLNWKKIAIKEKENIPIVKKDVSTFRKFPMFNEVSFDARGGKAREYHMDLGQFYEYLEQHNCGNIFSIYFGVEGKSSAISK